MSRRRVKVPKAKSCGTKQKYTQDEAQTKASSIDRWEGGGNRMNAYRCSHCGNWHVGHRRGLMSKR